MDSLDEMQLEMTLEKEFNIYLKKPNELHEYSFPEIVELSDLFILSDNSSIVISS